MKRSPTSPSIAAEKGAERARPRKQERALFCGGAAGARPVAARARRRREPYRRDGEGCLAARAAAGGRERFRFGDGGDQRRGGPSTATFSRRRFRGSSTRSALSRPGSQVLRSVNERGRLRAEADSKPSANFDRGKSSLFSTGCSAGHLSQPAPGAPSDEALARTARIAVYFRRE